MEEIYVLEDLLNTLVELEIKGYNFYEKCKIHVVDIELKQIFHELANAERNHEIFFKGVKNRVINSMSIEIDEEYKSYIKALIDNNFSISTIDFKAESLKEVLDIAEKIEKDTILFLNELKGIITEEFGFNEILEEERRHLLRIYDYKKAQGIM